MCIDQADPTSTSGKISCWRLQTSIRQWIPGVACIGVVTAGTSSGYFRLEHFQPFRTRNENFPSAIFPETVSPFLFSSSRHVLTIVPQAFGQDQAWKVYVKREIILSNFCHIGH